MVQLWQYMVLQRLRGCSKSPSLPFPLGTGPHVASAHPCLRNMPKPKYVVGQRPSVRVIQGFPNRKMLGFKVLQVVLVFYLMFLPVFPRLDLRLRWLAVAGFCRNSNARPHCDRGAEIGPLKAKPGPLKAKPGPSHTNWASLEIW